MKEREDGNTHIKEGLLKTSPPEPTSCNIQASTILDNSCGIVKVFAGEWLEIWFNTDIFTYLRHQRSSEIPNLVMSN